MPSQIVPLAGLTPAVFFVPVNYAVTGTPIAMLADPIDPATGELLSIERGFDPVDAAVINVMRTVRGSGSAVEDVGNRFVDAKKITPSLEAFLREEVRLAFAELVAANQVRLEEVRLETLDTEAGLLVAYTNVPAEQARKAFLPLGSLLGRAVS